MKAIDLCIHVLHPGFKNSLLFPYVYITLLYFFSLPLFCFLTFKINYEIYLRSKLTEKYFFLLFIFIFISSNYINQSFRKLHWNQNYNLLWILTLYILYSTFVFYYNSRGLYNLFHQLRLFSKLTF